MPATATQKPATQYNHLTGVFVESRNPLGNGTVDTENHVVRNVKLIGFESKNGRLYPPRVLEAAKEKYEGTKVNIDHPSTGDPNTPRGYGDRFGAIKNVQYVEGEGLFGDFHYNPRHPIANQFIYDAQHNPSALGFSHNATLRVANKKQDGKTVIEEILNVRSMDLVADPATTTSLFESMETNTMEPGTEPTPAPMEPSAGGDAKSQIKAAFKQMVNAAIDDESLDAKATLSKIRDILKSQEKLLGMATKEMSGGDGGDDDEGKEKMAEENFNLRSQNIELQNELKTFRAEKALEGKRTAITEEFKAAGLDPTNPIHLTEHFTNVLLGIEEASDRQEAIEDRAAAIFGRQKTRQGGDGGQGNGDTSKANNQPPTKPQYSVPASQVATATESYEPKNLKKTLTGRR